MSGRCSSTARYSTRTTVLWARPATGCAVSSKCAGPRSPARRPRIRKRIAEARYVRAILATALPTSTTRICTASSRDKSTSLSSSSKETDPLYFRAVLLVGLVLAADQIFHCNNNRYECWIHSPIVSFILRYMHSDTSMSLYFIFLLAP